MCCHGACCAANGSGSARGLLGCRLRERSEKRAHERLRHDLGEGIRVPEAEAAGERVLVGAESSIRRQGIQLLRVAAPEHDIVRLQCRAQLADRVRDVEAPTLLTSLLETGGAD